MAVTQSDKLQFGTKAPDFHLPDANPNTDATTYSLADVQGGRALVVVFTCNHCPYAKHIEEALVEVAEQYEAEGVRFVAICSNDAERYPSDSFEAMRKRADALGFPFPYLRDESQEVARAYGAVCTPDFFVFDQHSQLVYRGRFDETRPGGERAHGGELRTALDQLLKSGAVTAEQHPSIGCSIKWKEGAA